MLETAIKRHGGKSYLAKRIVALMPPRCKNPNAPATDDPGWLHYVEPFAGSLAVLFANDPVGISEVVNDLDSELYDFWRCLQEPLAFAEFSRIVQAIPFSQDEYRAAVGNGEFVPSRVARAVAFFVRNRQSRQGLETCFATLTRNRVRRGMNEQAAAWLSAVDGLPWFHVRLRRVLVLNDDALKVIQQQDGPRALVYADPPYVHQTRSGGGGEYKHEMTDAQHQELLSVLAHLRGKFILSGYKSSIYCRAAMQCGWNCEEIEIDNKASSAKSKEKKIECLWYNY